MDFVVGRDKCAEATRGYSIEATTTRGIQEIVRNLLISLKLVKINEENSLQKKIEDLRKEEKTLAKRTHPCKDDALQLSQ